MENQNNEAWIIMYTWESTDDWIGGFPSDLHQWFICEYLESKHPKIFDTEHDAAQYAVNNALINPKIIQVAGEGAVINFKEKYKDISYDLPF